MVMVMEATQPQNEREDEAGSRALQAEEQQDCPTPYKAGELGWRDSIHGEGATRKPGADVVEQGTSAPNKEHKSSRFSLTPNGLQILLLGVASFVLVALIVAAILLFPHPPQSITPAPLLLPSDPRGGNSPDPSAGGLIIVAISTLLTFASFAFYLRFRATYLHYRRQHLKHALSQPEDEEAEVGAPPFTPRPLSQSPPPKAVYRPYKPTSFLIQAIEASLLLPPSKIHPPPPAAARSMTEAQSAIVAEAARERERARGRIVRDRESIGGAIPAPQYGSEELEKDEVL